MKLISRCISANDGTAPAADPSASCELTYPRRFTRRIVSLWILGIEKLFLDADRHMHVSCILLILYGQSAVIKKVQAGRRAEASCMLCHKKWQFRWTRFPSLTSWDLLMVLLESAKSAATIQRRKSRALARNAKVSIENQGACSILRNLFGCFDFHVAGRHFHARYATRCRAASTPAGSPRAKYADFAPRVSNIRQALRLVREIDDGQ